MEGQSLLLVYVDCPQPTKGCVPKILFRLPTLKGKTQLCRDNVLNAGLASRPNHKSPYNLQSYKRIFVAICLGTVSP